MTVCWGEQNPDETPLSWSVWKHGDGGAVVIVGDPDWGKLQVGEDCLSSVIDSGDATRKQITVTPNKYGEGDESLSWSARGSLNPFNQLDEAPSWEPCGSPIIRRWRYIQVKASTAAATTTSTTTTTSTSSTTSSTVTNSTSSSTTSTSSSTGSSTISSSSTTTTALPGFGFEDEGGYDFTDEGGFTWA